MRSQVVSLGAFAFTPPCLPRLLLPKIDGSGMLEGIQYKVDASPTQNLNAVVKMPRTNTTHSQLGTEAIHKQLSDPGKDRPDQALIIPRVLPKYYTIYMYCAWTIVTAYLLQLVDGSWDGAGAALACVRDCDRRVREDDDCSDDTTPATTLAIVLASKVGARASFAITRYIHA